MQYDDAEEWRPVPDWEGLYEVSSHGRVKSVGRVVVRRDSQLLTVKPRIIRPWRAGHMGYHRVCFYRANIKTRYYVQVLVATVFLGPPPFAGAQAAHINHDPTDNHFSNLTWSAGLDNVRMSVEAGRHSRGERHGRAVLTEQVVRKIRQIGGSVPVKELARKYQVTEANIYCVLSRKTWKHVA